MSSYESTTERLGQHEGAMCSFVQDLLPLYLEGEVSPQSRDLIVEHLARCERCAGFLAGAQSVRVQLRREQAQRHTLSLDDQPARQLFSHLHWVVMSVAIVLFCGLGAAGSVMLLTGFSSNDGIAALVGALFVGSSYTLLAWLARARAFLTTARHAMLLGSCVIGAFGSVLLTEAPVPGLFVALIGLVGVFVAVFSGTPSTRVVRAQP